MFFEMFIELGKKALYSFMKRRNSSEVLPKLNSEGRTSGNFLTAICEAAKVTFAEITEEQLDAIEDMILEIAQASALGNAYFWQYIKDRYDDLLGSQIVRWTVKVLIYNDLVVMNPYDSTTRLVWNFSEEATRSFLVERNINHKPCRREGKVKWKITPMSSKDGGIFATRRKQYRKLEEVSDSRVISNKVAAYVGKCGYLYRGDILSSVKDLIVDHIDNIQISMGDELLSIKEGAAGFYKETFLQILNNLIVNTELLFSGEFSFDSRLRLILGDCTRWLTWQNTKLMRASLTMAEEYCHPLSDEGRQMVFWHIGRVLCKGSFKQCVKRGKSFITAEWKSFTKDGNVCWDKMDQASKHFGIELHEAMDIFRCWEEYRKPVWSYPVEFDATFSGGTIVSALLGNKELMNHMGLLNPKGEFHDGWNINNPKQIRSVNKAIGTPWLYSSSAPAIELAKKAKGFSFDENNDAHREAAIAFKEAWTTGVLAPLGAYSSFFTKAKVDWAKVLKDDMTLTLDFGFETLKVQMNKLGDLTNIPTKTTILKFRGGDERMGIGEFETVTRQLYKLEPDRFSTYLASCLIHHFDAYALLHFVSKCMKKHEFVLSNHDAVFIHPNMAGEFNASYLEVCQFLYDNGDTILDSVRKSLGISENVFRKTFKKSDREETLAGMLVK